MEQLNVKIKKLNKHAVTPSYAKDGDMCMDITAIGVKYDEIRDCYIYNTGLAFEIPKGYGMFMLPRSSNRNTEAYMTNHVAVIDSGYRGEVLVCFKNRISSDLKKLINNSIEIDRGVINAANTSSGLYELRKNRELIHTIITHQPYEIGDRIAQIVILPYPQINFVEVEELSNSERGDGGHGSTGR